MTSKPWPAYMVVKFLSVAVVAAQLFTCLPCLVFAICSQNVTDTLFNSTRPERTGIGGGAKSILQRNLQSHGVNYRRDRVVVRQSCHSKPTLPSHTQPQESKMPHSTWMWQVHRLNLHEITLLSDCSCRLTYLKKTFLFYFVLVVPCCSSPSQLDGIGNGVGQKRLISKEDSWCSCIYIYIRASNIYIYIIYIYIFSYISHHLCKRPVAESQGTCSVTAFAVQEPLSLRRKMLSLCLSNLQIQSICFLEDFWGPRAVTEHKLYCRILCKGKMADVSKQLVRTTTHTQLHYKYVGKPLQLLQLLLTQSTEQDIVPSSISC